MLFIPNVINYAVIFSVGFFCCNVSLRSTPHQSALGIFFASTLGMNRIYADLERFLGKTYAGYKGQEAISKLLREKQGYVPKAFYRADIGDIALVWGDENAGLAHIIKRRSEQEINVKELLSDLAEVIEKGKLKKQNAKGNFEILRNRKMAIISPAYHGNKFTFVISAFKTRKKS